MHDERTNIGEYFQFYQSLVEVGVISFPALASENSL